MANQTLRTALTGADGQTPVTITRIEIEVLDGQSGRCRWTLWSGNRRLYSRVARPEDRAAMLRDTATLLDVEAGRVQ